jgi:hypothetical protein
VMALARTLTPCLVVIDEKRGRRIADQVYGLPVKGTAGLLVEAHRRGLLNDVRTTLLDFTGWFAPRAAACAVKRTPECLERRSRGEERSPVSRWNHAGFEAPALQRARPPRRPTGFSVYACSANVVRGL